jgi:hypothetical protein
LGFNDWVSVGSVLDVDCFALFFGQEFGRIGNVFSWRNDDCNDTAADLGSLKSFEESFHSEDFDWVVFLSFLHGTSVNIKLNV